MTSFLWYALIGAALLAIGLLGALLHRHLVRRILALNIMGNGIFLIYIALADRAAERPDPVPQAMVLTGLVVAVSATALALALIIRLKRDQGIEELPEDSA